MSEKSKDEREIEQRILRARLFDVMYPPLQDSEEDSSLYSTYSTVEDQGSDEIIQAEIVPAPTLTPWPIPVVQTRRSTRRWKLPLVLFILTCLSTLYSGGFGADAPGWHEWLLYGLSYAVPVMIILVCHEMGHFLVARHYGVQASWPYFIPMPLTFFGTMGAMIFMRPQTGGRKAIFDIGISGPLAGLVPTIAFLIIGLQHVGHLVEPTRGELGFGVPPLFTFLAHWIKGPIFTLEVISYESIGPIAFAAWVGLFITSLNLIPIGQLDGGHILYALLRKKARFVARALLYSSLLFVFWNFKTYHGWLPMIVLVFFLVGPVHPPTANDEEPLGVGRTILGWLTLAFILIGITPIPIIIPR
jgi:membrane-associated protease RseP (regulator of RpoE activity)